MGEQLPLGAKVDVTHVLAKALGMSPQKTNAMLCRGLIAIGGTVIGMPDRHWLRVDLAGLTMRAGKAEFIVNEYGTGLRRHGDRVLT